MSVVEIRIRTFHTCPDADVAPCIAFTMEADALARQDWPAMLAKAIQCLSEMMESAPADGLRPMTRDEVREYQKNEAEEDEGFVSIARREAGKAN